MALRPLRDVSDTLELLALARAREVGATETIRLAQAGSDLPEPIRTLVQGDANQLEAILTDELTTAGKLAVKTLAAAHQVRDQLAGTDREVFETTLSALETLAQALGLLRAASGVFSSFLDARMVATIGEEGKAQQAIHFRPKGILGLMDENRTNEALDQAVKLAADAAATLALAREQEGIAAALLRDREGAVKVAENLQLIRDQRGEEVARDLARRLEGKV